MEDLITDFMCEPAEMDDWLSTAATSHSSKFSAVHDPGGLVGSSQGTGFYGSGDRPQQPGGPHKPGARSARPHFAWHLRCRLMNFI